MANNKKTMNHKRNDPNKSNHKEIKTIKQATAKEKSFKEENKKSEENKNCSSSKLQKQSKKEKSLKNNVNQSENKVFSKRYYDDQSKIVKPDTSLEITKLIKIIVVVVVIAVVFYGITILITKYKKDNDTDTNTTIPTTIQYDEIVLGSLFRQSQNEYYVLIQKEEDPYNSLLSSYISSYSAKANSVKVYLVNMDHVFNQFYVSTESNLNTNDIRSFRVSGLSMVKVSNKNIVESYEGIDAIENRFKELLK